MQRLSPLWIQTVRLLCPRRLFFSLRVSVAVSVCGRGQQPLPQASAAGGAKCVNV